MDTRTHIAAAWWTNELRQNIRRDTAEPGTTAGSPGSLKAGERHLTPLDGEASHAAQAESLSERQLEAFEAALAREIGVMLTHDLTNVLAVNHRWAAPQFSRAAATSGIEDILGKLPNETIMRIFPDTVMTHRGPQAEVEILWSAKKSLSGKQQTPANQQTPGA